MPAACGVKFTLIVQLAAAARELPQVFVMLNSPLLEPLIEMLVIASAALPRFESVADWLAAFDLQDACLTLVNNVREVITHPQVAHDRLIEDLGRIGPFIRLINTPAEFRLPPPKLGEHTREVLEDAGLPTERIEALAEAGIIGVGGDKR